MIAKIKQNCEARRVDSCGGKQTCDTVRLYKGECLEYHEIRQDGEYILLIIKMRFEDNVPYREISISILAENVDVSTEVKTNQIITSPGKYNTRSGEIVDVDTIDKPGSLVGQCHGTYSNGIKEWWYKTGHIFASGKETKNDIVSKVE